MRCVNRVCQIPNISRSKRFVPWKRAFRTDRTEKVYCCVVTVGTKDSLSSMVRNGWKIQRVKTHLTASNQINNSNDFVFLKTIPEYIGGT